MKMDSIRVTGNKVLQGNLQHCRKACSIASPPRDIETPQFPRQKAIPLYLTRAGVSISMFV